MDSRNIQGFALIRAAMLLFPSLFFVSTFEETDGIFELGVFFSPDRQILPF